jgi:hypothetical protein
MRWVGLRADFHPLDMPLITTCYTATKAPRGASHPTRVFLLDYDGTLTSIEKDPEKVFLISYSRLILFCVLMRVLYLIE